MTEWLNYHHLLYFWTVAREGSIRRACEQLHLTQPTISGQLRSLERSLGVKLFEKVGRNLTLSADGRVVFRYADEIFRLGRELRDAVNGRAADGPLPLVVGVADALPKLLVHRLLEPVLNAPEPVKLVCHEGKAEQMLAQLALLELDVVLADVPAPPTVKVRAFNHLIGESGISLFGTSPLIAAHRAGFPRSLDGAPFLLPTDNTALRRSLDVWFEAEGIRPTVKAEFADSALLKTFAQAGRGIFAAPTAVEDAVCRQFNVRVLGRLETVREQFYAITVERKLKHPAVLAMFQTARRELFPTA